MKSKKSTKQKQQGRESNTENTTAHVDPEQTRKSFGKRRKSNTENTLALCGYWSRPVQQVVQKWSPEIGQQWCEHYILACFFSVRVGTQEISVPLVTHGHKRYVLEVMLAIDRVLRDKEKPAAWLLELWHSGRYDADGKPNLPPYAQLADTIKRHSGKSFSVAALTQEARRLHLSDRKAA